MTWHLALSTATEYVLKIKNSHQVPCPIHKCLHGLLDNTLCNYLISSKSGSANYDSWAKSSPLPVAGNNV